MKSLFRILLAAVIAATGLLTGCASMSASSTEPLLSAAGFRARTPETAAQKSIYAELPPYQVQRGTHQGKVFYAYKNEKEGVAYVGGEAEYQKYQQLAVQRRIARDQYEAAQMNQAMAYRWYGAYPGSYYYHRPYPY
jgi:outer membrane murein-binding lipoprotein Lpp